MQIDFAGLGVKVAGYMPDNHVAACDNTGHVLAIMEIGRGGFETMDGRPLDRMPVQTRRLLVSLPTYDRLMAHLRESEAA